MQQLATTNETKTKTKTQLRRPTKNQFAQNYVYATCNVKRELTFAWCIMAVAFGTSVVCCRGWGRLGKEESTE